MAHDGQVTEWNLKVKDFLFTYRSTPHTVTKCTPASRFLGRELRSALDFLKPPKPPVKVETTVKKFVKGDRVGVLNFKTKKFDPGFVTKCIGQVLYEVKANGRYQVRHFDQLRPNSSRFEAPSAPEVVTWSPPVSQPDTRDDPVPVERQPSPAPTNPIPPSPPKAETPPPATLRRNPHRQRQPPDRYGHR